MSCGVTPEEGRVYAPVDGTVSQLAETLRAVGVDTVEMKGGGLSSSWERAALLTAKAR